MSKENKEHSPQIYYILRLFTDLHIGMRCADVATACVVVVVLLLLSGSPAPRAACPACRGTAPSSAAALTW